MIDLIYLIKLFALCKHSSSDIFFELRLCEMLRLSIQYMNISSWYCKVIRGCLHCQTHLSKILLLNDFVFRSLDCIVENIGHDTDSNLEHCTVVFKVAFQCKMKVYYITGKSPCFTYLNFALNCGYWLPRLLLGVGNPGSL